MYTTTTKKVKLVKKRALTTKSTRMPRIKAVKKESSSEIPVRFVPLGGLEEIGRNCMFFEYKNEIVVIDAGLQFPEEETPGVDYIIPNVSYLREKKSNIIALILTHGHYDHIGAIPYIIEDLGNPPIYATPLTKAIVLKRQEDFPNSPKLNIVEIKNGDHFKLSEYFSVTFFGVPHTVPESCGAVLHTPVGNIVNFADFRIEYDEEGNPLSLEDFENVGKLGIHTLMIDSTNAEKEGRSLSEQIVIKNLEEIFKKANGRIIVTTFSSLLDRIAQIIKIAERLGRKVTFSGYSMRSNVLIAQKLGYIKTEPNTIIPLEDVNKYPDNKILILTTGAQGEPNASLMRIISYEHPIIKIKPGDTVVFSSSVIPGNERSVQNIKDNLARQGAIVYHSDLVDIHASGHAMREDLKIVMKLIKPRFVVPLHGYYFMRHANAQNAIEVGIPKENVILMDNGQVAEIYPDKFIVTNQTVPSFYVMVDGLGVGDVEEVVLRDRRNLAQEGMIVLIVTIDKHTGKLLKSPDIISRGFIYLRESQPLLEEIRKKLRGLVARLVGQKEIDADYLKTLIREQISQFLYNKTKRRPMVLPVVIEV